MGTHQDWPYMKFKLFRVKNMNFHWFLGPEMSFCLLGRKIWSHNRLGFIRFGDWKRYDRLIYFKYKALVYHIIFYLTPFSTIRMEYGLWAHNNFQYMQKLGHLNLFCIIIGASWLIVVLQALVHNNKLFNGVGQYSMTLF